MSTQIDTSVDPSTLATTVFKYILKQESDYHLLLNETYGSLSESTFKSLRRALPVTRSKMDWNAIGTYKIGSELAQREAV